jgi:hypothetical protein
MFYEGNELTYVENKHSRCIFPASSVPACVCSVIKTGPLIMKSIRISNIFSGIQSRTLLVFEMCENYSISTMYVQLCLLPRLSVTEE